MYYTIYLSVTFRRPTSEVKIPIIHKNVKVMIIVLMLNINESRFPEFILSLPKNTCTERAATAILNIIPVVRIVDTVADASPKKRFSTELIIEFVFGEENIPKPNPKTIKANTI